MHSYVPLTPCFESRGIKDPHTREGGIGRAIRRRRLALYRPIPVDNDDDCEELDMLSPVGRRLLSSRSPVGRPLALLAIAEVHENHRHRRDDEVHSA